MKYSKQEIRELSWLIPMDTTELTLLEIANKIKYNNLIKLKNYLEINNKPYMKEV